MTWICLYSEKILRPKYPNPSLSTTTLHERCFKSCQYAALLTTAKMLIYI